MVATRGGGVIEFEDMAPLTFATGESVVVPASLPIIHAASAMGAGISMLLCTG